MNEKLRKLLIDELSKTGSTKQSIAITRQGKPVAVAFSVDDYAQFQIEREEKLKNLRSELNDILSLIRSRLNNQTLADLEAQLAAHRKRIEQENE